MRSHYYPCVSAPFSAVEYRDDCSLLVRAGCATSDTDLYSQVGCEMRAGSHIVLSAAPGPANSSAYAAAAAKLEVEWVVGPGSGADSPRNAFWIVRADGLAAI